MKKGTPVQLEQNRVIALANLDDAVNMISVTNVILDDVVDKHAAMILKQIVAEALTTNISDQEKQILKIDQTVINKSLGINPKPAQRMVPKPATVL